MFYAIYMPGEMWASFETAEAAWEFIEILRCPMCVDDARLRPHDPLGGCDAEWDVWTQEQWDEFGPLEPEHEITTMPKQHRRLEFTLFGITVGLMAAGLICVYRKDWCLHLLVRRRFWHWGYNHEWDLFVGGGPFFLFVAEW